MKLAIHHRPGSFSEEWITYCKRESIPFKIVNAFANDIIAQIKDCDGLLWHHHHGYYKDILTAKRILFALEHTGVKVFPDFKTGWHFDDKVAQKYLLEAIDAPLVPSFVFYEKQKALEWIDQTTFPKVWKLKGGAGAANVQLVHSKNEALKLAHKAFGKGFSQFNRLGYIKERYRQHRKGGLTLKQFLKSTGRLIIPRETAKMIGREKGYLYFQDFIPKNNSDTRIVVVGNRAAGEKRYTREGDFRASGSGKFSYDNIELDAVKLAFQTARKLQLQSVAFDFIFDINKKPLIVEMSYGFGTKGIKNVPGFWDTNLQWHKEEFSPQDQIIKSLIKSTKE